MPLTVGLAALIILSFGGVSTAALANVSRSYSAASSLKQDSLVSLVKGQSSTVEAANLANQQNLVGVVVNSNQSLLAFNASKGLVQVAIDGSANVLVSTVNGNISIGQQVAVSPFNGLGMKAGAGSRVIGTAATNFNSNSAGATEVTVKDKAGHSRQLKVGYLRVSISIGSISSGNTKLASLQQFVESLTGHPISIARLIVSLVIAILAIISIVTLIYAAIYGGVVSIGRNPLAKFAVLRSLSYVLGMVILVAAVALAIIYFLLY